MKLSVMKMLLQLLLEKRLLLQSELAILESENASDSTSEQMRACEHSIEEITMAISHLKSDINKESE